MTTNPFGDAPTTGELLPMAGEQPSPIPDDGRALRRTQDSHGFSTAIAVQQPRDLVAVERRVLQEAQLLGEHAYYGWPVKDKASGRSKMVEGATIKLASALARNWGNCVVDTLPVQESPDAWIFTAAFIDLETGFTLTRQFRQSRASKIGGRYDAERKMDMQFQNGQSRAARNAILNALPAGLISGAIRQAKLGVRARIESYVESQGIEAARDICLSELRKHGVSETAVLSKMSRETAGGLTIEDIVVLRGDLTALNDGAERPGSIFPEVDEPTESTADLREKLTKPAADAPTTNEVISQVQQAAPSEPEAVAEDDSDQASELRDEVVKAIVDMPKPAAVAAMERAGIKHIGDVVAMRDVPRLESILAAITKDP